MSDFHKPQLPGSRHFEAQPDREDPAETAAAGHRIATLLVRGPRRGEDHEIDQQMVDRVLHLADTEGLATIAELWAHAPPDTLAGSLWRLYALRTWVHHNPQTAAHEFAAGKPYAPVHEVLAGVVDPPGPAEVIALVDTVVRGIVGPAFDVTLDRAAAFAHIVGIGRSQLDSGDASSAVRLVDTATSLRRAADLERTVGLH